jgi:hypothetical protein
MSERAYSSTPEKRHPHNPYAQRAYSSTPKKRPLSQCSSQHSFSNPQSFDFASSGGITNSSINTKVYESPPSKCRHQWRLYSEGPPSDAARDLARLISTDSNMLRGMIPHRDLTGPREKNHNGNDTMCTDDDDDDDDEQQLSQILEMAPEFDGITKGIEQLSLNEEVVEEIGDELQEKAIGLAAEGKNIFLTGKAGTGKSWTPRKIVAACRSRKKIHITAPTGIAAINVNGRTIHSWGGFGYGEYMQDFDKMMGPETMKKIRDTDTLLIDLISCRISGSME